jgi:hypothetical protein
MIADRRNRCDLSYSGQLKVIYNGRNSLMQELSTCRGIEIDISDEVKMQKTQFDSTVK